MPGAQDPLFILVVVVMLDALLLFLRTGCFTTFAALFYQRRHYMHIKQQTKNIQIANMHRSCPEVVYSATPRSRRAGGMRRLWFVNKAGQDLWVGGYGSTLSNCQTGFALKSGATAYTDVSDRLASGRFWARTRCVATPGNVQSLTCETGDCKGRAQCAGVSGDAPASLFEITMAGASSENMDSYDISVVDGYNVGIMVEALQADKQTPVDSLRCTMDPQQVPSELRATRPSGDAHVLSLCSAAHDPAQQLRYPWLGDLARNPEALANVCCDCANNGKGCGSPDCVAGCSPYNVCSDDAAGRCCMDGGSGPGCQRERGGRCYVEQWPRPSKGPWPDQYPAVFKWQCPDAYSWQFDDAASLRKSTQQPDYRVTFLPNGFNARAVRQPQVVCDKVRGVCRPPQPGESGAMDLMTCAQTCLPSGKRAAEYRCDGVTGAVMRGGAQPLEQFVGDGACRRAKRFRCDPSTQSCTQPDDVSGFAAGRDCGCNVQSYGVCTSDQISRAREGYKRYVPPYGQYPSLCGSDVGNMCVKPRVHGQEGACSATPWDAAVCPEWCSVGQPLPLPPPTAPVHGNGGGGGGNTNGNGNDGGGGNANGGGNKPPPHRRPVDPPPPYVPPPYVPPPSKSEKCNQTQMTNLRQSYRAQHGGMEWSGCPSSAPYVCAASDAFPDRVGGCSDVKFPPSACETSCRV